MENPNFYAIIPANVRYADIIPNAKLLYGEITALANKTGVCFASNGYFASLYGVNDRQISRWLLDLINNGFISVIIKKNEGNKREISINNNNIKNKNAIVFDEGALYINKKLDIGISMDKNRNICIDKNVDTYRRKSLDLQTKKTIGIDEKDLSYNKYNNTINNTIIIAEEEKEIFENNIIESLDEFRLFLNKGKLQDLFYYKIGDNDSFERCTTDFFLYMEEKDKKINKKTAEARFISFLKPKWETAEDIEELKKIYNRKLNKIKQKNNIQEESEEEKQNKIKDLEIKNKRFKEIEIGLSENIKRQYRQQAEDKINLLTKGHGKNLSTFGLMVENKYRQIILDSIDKESQ